MTTTQNLDIRYRISKSMTGGAGSRTVWTVLLDGKSTGILVRSEGFDFETRTQRFSIIDRDFRDVIFPSKREAAEAALRSKGVIA